MTPTEAIDFVELVVAAWPNTRTEDKTADIWYAAGLNEVSWDDGTTAIRSLLKTKSFISLAEILGEVRHIRELRLAARPIPEPGPELADNPPVYREELQSELKRVADGTVLPKALPSPGHGATPGRNYDRGRGVFRDPLRIAAMKVHCPWANCGALIGEGCRTYSGRTIEGHGHDARLVAAGIADWVEIAGVQRAVLRGQDSS